MPVQDLFSALAGAEMTYWQPSTRMQQADPTAVAEAQNFEVGFSQGRAGAMGWPAKTNLIARSEWKWNEYYIPINAAVQQGQTLRQAPSFASPTTLPKPMRASDTLRVYESQLTQIQDYLIGTP